MKSKINLLEHSESKVGLYGRYLSIYLNVLARSYVKNIYIFDLFCGEGVYKDNGKGSPIVTLDCIKRHYFANDKKCPNIYITFNDIGNSEIEPTKSKTERVNEFADKIFKPENVKVGYSNIEYNVIIEKVIERTNKLKNDERALIFIDPWGYKEINPFDIKRLMDNGKTEVLLFLPIYFMSRFVQKSKDIDYKGGKALRNFIGNLFGSIDNFPFHKNQVEFIYLIQEKFKEYLKLKYVDTFKIERDKNLWFALYFFTNSPKGFLKMLESKWSLDKKHGIRFKKGDEFTLDIFDEITISGYENKVLKYLKNNNSATNIDLFNFGLENNFLPTHTRQVLNKLKTLYTIEIISLDGKAARSFYLSDEKRLVNIKLK